MDVVAPPAPETEVIDLDAPATERPTLVIPQQRTSVEDGGYERRRTTEADGRDESPRRWLLAALAAFVAVLLVVGGLLLIMSRGSGPSFTDQARRVLRPVAADNQRLVVALAALTPTSGSAAVTSLMASSLSDSRAAEAALSALQPGGSTGRSVAGDATAALHAEMAWLTAGSAALTAGAQGDVSQLAALELGARDAWSTLTMNVGHIDGRFPTSAVIVRFVHAKATTAAATQAAASLRAALRQFSDQVSSMLNQSQAGRTQIDTLFSEMQTIASGGYSNLTLPQAQSTISTVISNRTSLAASVRSLNAPNPLAVRVRNALATALDASLTDDQQIDNCLTEANNGIEAFIFQGCLDNSATASLQATQAKDAFTNAYNRLRRQVGQAAIHETF